MALLKKNKKNESATNEFDQVIVGTSLTKEAWKRLKKNKLAVVGGIIVIIYALVAICADLLPLYPYDQAITSHRNLRPSLTKTAGELMLEQEMKNLFFQAWRGGRLEVPDEEDALIEQWVRESKTNKVWDLLYERGMAALEDGSFTWSSSEQRRIDNVLEDIETETLITIDSVSADLGDGMKRIDDMSYDELVSLYAGLLGTDVATVESSLYNEVSATVSNELRANDSTLSGEDLTASIEMEMDAMGRDGFENRASQNLVAYIEQLAQRGASSDVNALISSGDAVLPYKGVFDLSSGLHVELEVSRMHDRHYYCGTDYLGRDLLSRIIYGSQISIAIGIVGTVTSIFIGILVGALAGYLGGKVDYYLMRFVDIMYGLPYMLLVIICMAIFGRNIVNLFFALALVSWLTIARMVRGQIMSLKNQEYVEAARSMGAGTMHIIFRHMIPNSLSVIIVYSTIRIPAFIMQESFLSFLGLGVQAPYASWGSLIGDAVSSMSLYPYKLLIPSIVMVVFLFSMNFLGDGLRDAFDPQSKNQL